MKKIISIIAPMYNEEGLVHAYCTETINALRSLFDKYDFELLLVNDGSKDGTYNLMKQEQLNYPDIISLICLSRNFGLEGAVNAGIRMAVGDAVVVMDADLQDPPSLIPEMIKRWEKGADVVVCSRETRSNDTIFKKAGAGLYYKVLDRLSGKLKLEKSAANFRLLSRKALDQVLALPEKNSVFRVVVPFIGMRTDVIGYDRDKRYAGKTKYNLRTMIPYALDSITGISIEPLRKLSLLHIIPLAILIISICGIIVCNNDWIRMWTAMMLLSILFEGIFICISVLAEYLAQIMMEVKGRPLSIIYEYIPSDNVKGRPAMKSQA